MPLHLTLQTLHKKLGVRVPEIISFTTLIRIASANRPTAASPLAPCHRHGHFDADDLEALLAFFLNTPPMAPAVTFAHVST